MQEDEKKKVESIGNIVESIIKKVEIVGKRVESVGKREEKHEDDSQENSKLKYFICV